MNYIYKITNKITNKSYIGQTTKSIDERWKGHIAASTDERNASALYRSMRKYGLDNFILELIEEVPDYVSLDDRERYWISYYNTYGWPNGYNETIGGNMFSKDTNPMNLPEVRVKVSNSIKDKWANDSEYREKQVVRARQAWTGDGNPSKTPEARARISARVSGSNNPACRQDVREKISKSKTGKRASDEARKHMSEGSAKIWLGKKLPKDAVEKRRQNVVSSGVYKGANNPAALKINAYSENGACVYTFSMMKDAISFILNDSDLLSLIEPSKSGKFKGKVTEGRVYKLLRDAIKNGSLFCKLYWVSSSKCND